MRTVRLPTCQTRNYFGIDTYVYQICDDDGACDQATVTITISDVNDAPIAVTMTTD